MTKLEHIPIFYEGQDDLVDVLATSMASVCCNTKSFIDFYILDCGICDFNKKLLEQMKERFDNCSIQFIPVDLKQFQGLKGYGRCNFIDCYSRLLIPELKPELDRAIYLDTDTISLRDISELWNENIGTASIGVPPDLGLTPAAFDNFYKNLHGSSDHVYFSGGVFILNCKKWREKHITKDLLKLAKLYKDKLWVIIEELFSLYFETDFKLLNARYAMIDGEIDTNLIPVEYIDDKYMNREWLNVSIMHFAGASKPWQYTLNPYVARNIKNYNSFCFFAEMTPFYDGLQAKLYNNIIRRYLCL